ncbi:MAG: hypothetical protein DRJ51_03925 [Thermoprotei archaeon]|nr:MAG: hypothetical protein DRJ51_03925 [Thermoprotei archaeon]RLE82021.1 MAG: hypothetical protein DRJ36_00895 [Thermoprotei archaeon]RLF01903.1 MAG: hypothetical protein DRJ59_04990 [Thermoprotei archaeon]
MQVLSAIYSILLEDEKVKAKIQLQRSDYKDLLSQLGFELSDEEAPFFMLKYSRLLELGKESLVSPLDLRKMLLIESKSSTLQKVPEDFYVRIILSVMLLKKRYELEGKEEILKDINEIKETAIDILRKRLQKIVSLAHLNPEPSRELMTNMSFEERIIYRRICDIISSWEKFLINYLERKGNE